jgi:hypothetical protein
VSPSEHDKAHYKFREWTERAREGVVGLVYSLLIVFVINGIEELTYGTPRLKPTPP